MSEVLFSVGNIIKDKKQDVRYRVVAIVGGMVTLSEMDTTRFVLLQIDKAVLLDLLLVKELEIEQEEVFVFDVESLSPYFREKYEKKLKIINEVLAVSNPSFMNLVGKAHKPEINEIIKKNNIAPNSFRRICAKYFQSGMKNHSLVDSMAYGVNKGKVYRYNSKPGAKSIYFGSTGVVLTEEIKQLFEEGLKEFKSGRHKSIRSCFDRMNNLHFSTTELINGIPALVLKPQNERPTYRQFSYYINKHLTQQEKSVIKTSIMEHRNNKRILISDSLEDVYGPGDMVEIDACEADVSIVSMLDSNQSVGRPIVYFMMDVYSKAIVAVSIAFDNNSILGITNLFLNLADNKQEYCKRFGIQFDNANLWPSNFLPRRVRVDRGSEFKSKNFERICMELGIELQIVTGGSGSLKGNVEQSFHQMHSRQNVHLENYGLIEKRYDSKHHKESTLNIDQYSKMVMNFVLTHNQQFFKNYPLTKDMLEKNVRPIPSLLWEYGIEKYGNPRPIPLTEQYIYSLMTPIKAKLSRKGICFKNLWYITNNDEQLSRDIYKAGVKTVEFKARMDMRNVGAIYYIRDNKLIKASLNDNRTGNIEYDGLTMKQYEDYLKLKKQMNAVGKIHNERLSAYNYAVNESIVDNAKKKTYSNVKNIRVAREAEKQRISSENEMSRFLSDKIQEEQEVQKNPVIEGEEQKINMTLNNENNFGFEDALDLFE